MLIARVPVAPGRSRAVLLPFGYLATISRRGILRILPPMRGGAPPTHVRGGGASGTSTTPQVTLAGAPAQGDLLIGFVNLTAAVSATLSAASAWTEIAELSANGKAALFWKIAGAGESTTQQPGALSASVAWGCGVSQWNNAAGWGASPVDVHNEAAQASSTSYTTPSVTPASGREAVVASGFYAVDTGRSFSAEAVSGSNVGTVFEDGDAGSGALATAAISSTTGAYQGSATCSAARAGGTLIAIFHGPSITAQALTASATGTASLVKRTNLTLGAVATGTASLVKRVGKILGASATGSASLTKRVNLILSAAATGTADLSLFYGTVHTLTLSAVATGGATIRRLINKALDATATGTPTLNRRIPQALSATATGTATIVRRMNLRLSATAVGLVELAAASLGHLFRAIGFRLRRSGCPEED